MLKTRKFGISWLDIAVDIARWKINFSSARNWGEGSILPVVPFRFDQFKSDRTLLAYQFVCSTVNRNSFRMSELFALKIPFAIFTICLLLITPPAWRVPIAIYLTFLIWLSSKRFGLPTFLKTKLSPPVLHLFFQLFTKVLINVNSDTLRKMFWWLMMFIVDVHDDIHDDVQDDGWLLMHDFQLAWLHDFLRNLFLILL